MLFNSYVFILLFLPLAILGYYLVSGKKRMIYLLLLSVIFCGYQGVAHLAVLLLSIVCSYGITILLRYSGNPKKKKAYLALGIFFQGGMLLGFKLANVFLGTFMPFGVSFYTFGQIAYLVDFYRGEGRDYYFLEYATATAFFPKLAQGPITYHSELIPQFRSKEQEKPNYVNMSKGLYSFAIGLAKKVLLADSLSKIVAVGYGNIEALNCQDVILIMICYSLQLYFDFSGYCDMAMGIGHMLNLELPLNFNSPYRAVSISDFWDRWHMTLTRFFTKYLYFPLGGNRKGKVRTYINIFIVFLVSGFWHGANWTFLLWGAFHGILMIFERVFHVEKWRLPRWIRQLGTFILTTFAWSVFRADSIGQAVQLWSRLAVIERRYLYAPIRECFEELTEVSMLMRLGLSWVQERFPGLLLILFVAALMTVCFTMRNTQEKVQNLKLTKGKAIITVGLLFWSILSLAEITTFLYVNF